MAASQKLKNGTDSMTFIDRFSKAKNWTDSMKFHVRFSKAQKMG
jgi:hypothetical protein